jgi:hypothetical protein
MDSNSSIALQNRFVFAKYPLVALFSNRYIDRSIRAVELMVHQGYLLLSVANGLTGPDGSSEPPDGVE